MTETASKVFLSAEAHLKQLCENLKDEEDVDKPANNFSLQEFWLKLDNAVTEISQTSTQIAMAYAKPPLPHVKDVQEAMNGVQAACDNLVSVYNTLPTELGHYFHQNVHRTVNQILKSILSFVQSFEVKGNNGAKERLKCAVHILTDCEKVQKMPKNNLESIINLLDDKEALLLDVLQDIEEEVKSDFSAQRSGEEIDNNELWNNQDRELLPPCIGLVKTARTCVKKITSSIRTNGDCKVVSNISELDSIAIVIEDLSPAVDDFVASIYPPMNQRNVKKAARNVVNILQNLLNQVKDSHFIKEEDQNWLRVLLKSVDHNNNKLQPLFSQEKDDECPDTENSDDSDSEDDSEQTIPETDDDEDEEDEDEDDDDEDDEDEEDEK